MGVMRDPALPEGMNPPVPIFLISQPFNECIFLVRPDLLSPTDYEVYIIPLRFAKAILCDP